MAEFFDIVVPVGWRVLDYSETSSFASELVPETIRKTAKPGTTYKNPTTGVTLQKQQSGRWKKISTTAPPSQKSSNTNVPATQYPEKTSDSIVIGFGRFNPPTIGHQKLIEHIAKVAKEGNSDYNIFGSHSQDPKKNPLDSGTKTSYMQKMFPNQAGNIVYDKDIKSILDALEGAYKRGYKVANVVVGSDRLEEFKDRVNKYNGEGKKYNFTAINVISAGDRDENSNDEVSGMSASKMRKAATEGDFDTFSRGMPNTLSEQDKKELYSDLRNSMGVNKSNEN